MGNVVQYPAGTQISHGDGALLPLVSPPDAISNRGTPVVRAPPGVQCDVLEVRSPPEIGGWGDRLVK